MTTNADKKHIIEQLEDLMKHDGWLYLKDHVLEKDIISAAMDMAENKPISEAEFNFRRGTMYAAKGFTNAPEKVRDQLAQEIMFDDALVASKEAE